MDVTLSDRIRAISESMTLKMSERAGILASSGKKIYNLTAGELPFRPPEKFVQCIGDELDSLASYHYSPVAGIFGLRKKNYGLASGKPVASGLRMLGWRWTAWFSHGGKQALANFFCGVDQPGGRGDRHIPLLDQFIPNRSRFCGGKAVVVETLRENGFVPDWESLQKAINPRTRAIVVNSPNNPAGVHYSAEWMEEFADFMGNHPDIVMVSDENLLPARLQETGANLFIIKKNPKLLGRTVVIDGISKFFASTGLRLGWALAPKALIRGMVRFQGQTTSGVNSLIQRGLMGVDLPSIENYLNPIKKHLDNNADIVRDVYRNHGLEHLWYPTTSAFYYLVDFSRTRQAEGTDDCSMKVCEHLLERHGIVTAPGIAFGVPHSIRINLAMERKPFGEAMERIVRFPQGFNVTLSETFHHNLLKEFSGWECASPGGDSRKIVKVACSPLGKRANLQKIFSLLLGGRDVFAGVGGAV